MKKLLASMIGVLLVLPTNAAKLENLGWIEARSNNFQIYSVLGQEETNYAMNTIGREDISLRLGELSLRHNKLKRAERYYNIALTKKELAARAYAGIGDTYKFRGLYDQAEAYFAKAEELGADDFLALLDIAEFWHDQALEQESDDERNRMLKKARVYYGQAWRLNDKLPEIYAMNGESLVDQELYQQSLDSLETAYHLMPSSVRVKTKLAQAYAGVGRIEEARKQARAVIAWTHKESEYSKTAQEILNSLEQSQPQNINSASTPDSSPH